MKKQKILPFLLCIVLFLFISSRAVWAEERSIFVGDLINIKVSTVQFTEDELREKFKDFEIVNIKNDEDGYLITLRSFETGEKKVQLGNKEIEIVVKSTLDEVEQEEIFEGDLNTEEAGLSLNFNDVFYILLTIFLSTALINLWRFIKKRKISLISTYQHFINETNNITLNDKECFVKMTVSLKGYLESSYSCCIRGKTSTEIIGEIRCIPDLQSSLTAISSWLKKCDFYKFTGVIVSRDEKQEILKELVEIVEMIEKIQEAKEVEV